MLQSKALLTKLGGKTTVTARVTKTDIELAKDIVDYMASMTRDAQVNLVAMMISIVEQQAAEKATELAKQTFTGA